MAARTPTIQYRFTIAHHTSSGSPSSSGRRLHVAQPSNGTVNWLVQQLLDQGGMDQNLWKGYPIPTIGDSLHDLPAGLGIRMRSVGVSGQRILGGIFLHQVRGGRRVALMGPSQPQSLTVT